MAIPDIVVNISANADALTSGLSAAQGQVAAFGSKAVSSFQNISAIATTTASKLTSALAPVQEAAASGVFGQIGTDASQGFQNLTTAIATASQSATVLRTVMAGGIFGIIGALATAGVWFYKLQERAGGVGKAVGLLWDVVKESFGRIRLATEGLKEAFNALTKGIQFAFIHVFQAVSNRFSEFINPMIRGINNVLAALRSKIRISEIGAETNKFLGDLKQGLEVDIKTSADKAKAALSGMVQPLESWRKIQELMSDKPADIPEAPETTETPGASGTRTRPGRDELRERYFRLQRHLMSREELLTKQYERDLALLEVYHERQETADKKRTEDRLKLEEEYQRAIGVLRAKEQQSAVNAVMGGMTSVLSAIGERNKKILRISKIFGAAQALANAYVAASQTLADPTLPWYAKFAAAAAVLAKGIGFVTAIKGVNESGATGGGGGGGGRGSAAAPAVTQEGQRSTAAVINLSGGDMFSRDQVVGLINSINEAMEDGARLRIA